MNDGTMKQSILITQCLQNDFTKLIGKFDGIPNLLHVGFEEARRLLSEKVRLKFGKKCPASAGIITAEIYVHVMPGGLEKAISVFDKVVPTKA